MPLSLKTMLKKFAHKGQITQEEYDALIKKLDGHDKEVRAKAIDRFLTEMLNEFDSRYADIEEHTGSYVVSRLHAVAEQLKEE